MTTKPPLFLKNACRKDIVIINERVYEITPSWVSSLTIKLIETTKLETKEWCIRGRTQKYLRNTILSKLTNSKAKYKIIATLNGSNGKVIKEEKYDITLTGDGLEEFLHSYLITYFVRKILL